MASRAKPVVKKIKENQLGILMTILGLIQGLAFSRLIILTFEVLRGTEFSWFTLSIGLHAVFSLLIIIRLFETIFLGFLDYEDSVINFSVVIFIFIIGAFEYWVIDTFLDFSAETFYSRIIYLAIMTLIGYGATTLNISTKKNRRKIFRNYSGFQRELLLQLINLVIPLIMLIISAIILKGVLKSDSAFSFAAIGLSILLTINIITSWLLTVEGPKVIEPWDYDPNKEDNSQLEKPESEEIVYTRPGAEDAMQIAEIFLSTFPYVFKDIFETEDKRIIRILSRLTVYSNGELLYGYRNLIIARESATGKILGFIYLTGSSNGGYIKTVFYILFTLSLVFFHTGFMGLPLFLKNIFRNRKAKPVIPDNQLYISYIGVLNPYRKNGIAGDLLAIAEKIAIKDRKESIGLDVRTDNTDAIRLFSTFDFNSSRTIKDDAFGKPPRIYMTKRLIET